MVVNVHLAWVTEGYLVESRNGEKKTKEVRERGGEVKTMLGAGELTAPSTSMNIYNLL